MRSCVISIQSLTAISWPIRSRNAARSWMSIIVEATALGYELLQKRRRLPVRAEAGAVVLHARQHRGKAHRVGVKHRTAAMTRKSEAVAVDDVDIAGAKRKTFLEHARPFVGQCRRDPCDDLLVGDSLASEATPGRRLGRQLLDERIRNPRATAGFVPVPSRACFLTVAAHRKQAVGHLRLRTLRARLAGGGEVLPDPGADVDPGDILHAVWADGQT